MGDQSTVLPSTWADRPQNQFQSTAYEASHLFRAGNLANLVVTSKSASDRYLMVFDSASVPSNGAANFAYPPVWVPAKSSGGVSEELAQGMPFKAGVCAVLSSTEDTLTITGAADGWFKVKII